MIIWGRRGFKEELGNTTLKKVCPHCNNEVTYKGLEYGSKFTLFFIPLFPINKKRMVVCPICSHGYDVTKQELEKILV